MNETTLRILLDQDHLAYVRRQLDENVAAGRRLGALVAEWDLAAGHLEAVLPAETAKDGARDLETDAIRGKEEQQAVLRGIVQRLQELTANGGPTIILVEHWTGLEYVHDSPAAAFMVGDSAFDYTLDVDDGEQVERLLLASLFFPTVGLLARLPTGLAPAHGAVLSEDDLASIAERPLALLIGAWTADGYVLWIPPSCRLEPEGSSHGRR